MIISVWTFVIFDTAIDLRTFFDSAGDLRALFDLEKMDFDSPV